MWCISQCVSMWRHSSLSSLLLPSLSLATRLRTPVVCWHGFNDDSESCQGILSTIPGDVYTLSIRLGESLEEDKYNSVFRGMMEQVRDGCEIVTGDPALQGGYHAVGLSQGGLLLRGLAQLCDNTNIRSLVTLGSPHQGIFGLPRCNNQTIPCSIVRNFLSLGAYVPWIQDLLAPAQYWQDPWRAEDYKKFSKYLAVINNQRDVKNPRLKENLLKLDNFVLVTWQNDTFIKPKESSQFEFYFPNTTSAIQNLTDSPIYTEDWIGLRTLEQRNKLHFLTMAGDHMDFDRDWFYQNIVLPYLL